MKISKKQFALLAWFFIFLVPVWKGISNVVYYATDAKVSLFVLSVDGFTILTFIGLYIVTAYLKTHVNYQKIKAIWFLLVYVLVSGIFIVISFYSLPIYARFRQYNNPYLWVTAFSLFLFFVNLKPIKVNEHIGKIIKLLASCSLAVYIMHFNLFQNILRYRLYEFFNQNLNNIFGSWLALVFVLIFSCYLTEIIRKAIMYFINPSAKLFFEKINFNFIKPLN